MEGFYKRIWSGCPTSFSSKWSSFCNVRKKFKITNRINFYIELRLNIFSINFANKILLFIYFCIICWCKVLRWVIYSKAFFADWQLQKKRLFYKKKQTCKTCCKKYFYSAVRFVRKNKRNLTIYFSYIYKFS